MSPSFPRRARERRPPRPAALLLLLLGTEVCPGSADAEATGAAAAPVAGTGRRRLFGVFSMFGKKTHDDNRLPITRLLYSDPVQAPGPVDLWYNQLVPEIEGANTYFSVLSHTYGFTGFQQVSGLWGYSAHVVFQMWDGCSNLAKVSLCPDYLQAKVLQCGETASCERYRYEGIGSGIHVTVEESVSTLSTAYGFVVSAKVVNVSLVAYSSYFHSDELGGWTLLAEVQVPVPEDEWPISNLHSFVKPFTGRDLDVARSGKFGPSFVHAGPGALIQLRDAVVLPGMDQAEQEPIFGGLADDNSLWRIGVGGTPAESFASAVLQVAASAYPKQLLDFIERRKQGLLPAGCKGGTCPISRVNYWMNHHAFPVCLIVLGLVVMCCYFGMRMQPAYFHKRAKRNPQNFLMQ